MSKGKQGVYIKNIINTFLGESLCEKILMRYAAETSYLIRVSDIIFL